MRTLHLHISIYMFQTPSIQLPLCNNVIHPIGIQPHCTVVKTLSTNSWVQTKIYLWLIKNSTTIHRHCSPDSV